MLHTNIYLDQLKFGTYFCSVATGMPSNKTQKNPRLNFRAINFCRGTTQPGYMGTIMNLQIVFNTPKIPPQIKLPQKTSQNSPTQKNREIENFKPKNPSIIPVYRFFV